MRLKLSDLQAMGEEQRNAALAKLVAEAKKPGRSPAIQARINAYEAQYGMTSDEMRARFKEGSIQDTADIASWMLLLLRP